MNSLLKTEEGEIGGKRTGKGLTYSLLVILVYRHRKQFAKYGNEYNPGKKISKINKCYLEY